MPFAISWQTKLIIAAVLAAIAFGAGWKTRDAFCDAAAAKAEVEALSKKIEARDAAALQDQANAAQSKLVQEQLEGTIRDLESKISAGVCFGADDADRLRHLWR